MFNAATPAILIAGMNDQILGNHRGEDDGHSLEDMESISKARKAQGHSLNQGSQCNRKPMAVIRLEH
jgi:hypothetical protein